MALRCGERNMVNQAGKKKVEATFFNNDRSYNKRLILVVVKCFQDIKWLWLSRLKTHDSSFDKLTQAQKTPRSVAGMICI